MDKHEALIREIAEEMAVIKYRPTLYVARIQGPNVYKKQNQAAIEAMIECARIAVKRMAEMYEAGAYSLYDNDLPGNMASYEIERGQIERGLIPSPKTDNNG